MSRSLAVSYCNQNVEYVIAVVRSIVVTLIFLKPPCLLINVFEGQKHLQAEAQDRLRPRPHPSDPTSDNTHDERVGDGRLDVQGLLVECLELLAVLLLRVHLDLQRVHLQQLSAFLHVVLPLRRLARQVQLLQDASQSAIVPTVETQLPQLQKRTTCKDRAHPEVKGGSVTFRLK